MPDTDPLDTVTDIDRAQQGKDALIAQIQDAMAEARARTGHLFPGFADAMALGHVEAQLAPGQLRELLAYVERLGADR